MKKDCQSFFLQKNIPNCGELLNNMDVYTMLHLIRFGKKMYIDANKEKHECYLLGQTLYVNAIDKDMELINNNLNNVKKAYSLAMN